MARPSKLSAEAVEAALARVPGWAVENGKLCREFRFRDFNEAFGFMTRAALRAEVLNHHPEWSNVYARVAVALVTHDAGGITELDFQLAEHMNAIAAGRA